MIIECFFANFLFIVSIRKSKMATISRHSLTRYSMGEMFVSNIKSKIATIGRQGLTHYSMGKMFVSIRNSKMATIGRQGLTQYSMGEVFCVKQKIQDGYHWKTRFNLVIYSMGKLFVSIRKYKMAAIARHCLTRYSVEKMFL